MVKNIKKANVENTMMALGGAFLLNAIYEPSVICLVKSGEAKVGRMIRSGVHRFYKHDTTIDWDLIRKIITDHLLKKNEYVNLQTRFFMIQYHQT